MVTPGGLVVLTDRRMARRPLTWVVREAVRGGASWVILRERDLPYGERFALAASLRALLPAGRLIVAGPDPLDGDAVHLAAVDPLPSGPVTLVGRSCHDFSDMSAMDYVTLSPIYPTRSKPGYGPPLGPAAAAGVAGDVPWLALGGVDSASRAAACAAAGARGIAVMGAIMGAADPAGVTTELITAFQDRLGGVMPSPAPTLPGERNEDTACQADGTGCPQAAGRGGVWRS
ncbi:MAG: thiamine phosphate synthase [Actinomycetota bacterium]|nr:thiamine phosphate synthase [Actinomycetota bacterium]